jgi:septal ring factor EnvC (AmiA/AmiB activator)
MAIDMFVRIRSELRMMETEVEKTVAECKQIYNENDLLRKKIKELEEEIEKLKETKKGE